MANHRGIYFALPAHPGSGMQNWFHRRDTVPFAGGFLLTYGTVAYLALVIGTRDLVCIAVTGVYCNWFYPELFFLNALLQIPNGTLLAGALALLSWGLLALAGGMVGLMLGRGVRKFHPSDVP